MWFLCTIQPNLAETQEAGYMGEWMTVEEKQQAIEKFHRLNQAIPISVLHTAPKSFGSGVPHKDRAGRVVDLLCDRDGDMVAKCVVPRESPAFRVLHQGTHLNNEVWGVSPRIDWCAVDGETGPYRIIKTLTHVALTLTPAMADKGTYIHHWATNEAAIDSTIAREYYTEGQGHCYAAEKLRNRLRELNGMINFVLLSCTHALSAVHSSFCSASSARSLHRHQPTEQQHSRHANRHDRSNSSCNTATIYTEQQQQQRDWIDSAVKRCSHC